MRTITRFVVPLLAAGALAACGSDDDDGATADRSEQTTTTQAETQAQTAPDGATGAVQLEGETATFTAGELTFEGKTLDITAVEPATADGDAIALPIQDGQIDASDLRGRADLDGGIAFGEVQVEDLRVDTRTGLVTGMVDGSRVQVMRFDAGGLEVQRSDGRAEIAPVSLALTEDGAAALNDALGGSELSADQQVGELKLDLVPILPDAAGAPSP